MKESKYVSRQPDENGFIEYTDEENAIWHDLIVRQEKIIKGRVCSAYLEGLKKLNLPHDRIPQLCELNKALKKETGFQVEAVPALISPRRFFELLKDKKFPVATFIRTREDFDYIQEPDVFHEVYGHCPLLTCPIYCDFMQKYGEKALELDDKYLWRMQRLFWFTIEFGLIEEDGKHLSYGAGIISSPEETVYAVESNKPKRVKFDPVEAFRTPYRIDILQTVYYVVESFQELYNIFENDLEDLIQKAVELGQHEPTFPPKEELSC